ncbi:MAG: GNAT family N-acetyltransferase [Eubacteriaceae bacterium]|nr:GNAT family N-acetyltransferase [Eubacteriaceae bacterium]
MQIRFLFEDEFDKVWHFYDHVIEKMKDSPFDPDWNMEYYPDAEYITDSLKEKRMLGMVDEDGRIISCMVINHELEGDFDDSVWNVEATWDEVIAIHTFGVLPEYHSKGISRQMMDYIISYAKNEGYKAIRLDVMPGNIPAEKLYLRYNFTFIGNFTEVWDDGSSEEFKVYELVL